jgi:aspartate aminotransferase
MLPLSDRGKIMPESPIRKLVPYAEEAKKKGIKVFHLNIGQPDIETPGIALNAIRNIKLNVVEYSHSAGIESYRRKLVEYYRRAGIQIDHSEIMVTCGGSEAIIFAFISCLNPGEEIIIPEPFYTNYNGFAVQSGVILTPITTYIESGFALPPIEEFEKVITPKTKGILICNPNNPTGYLYSKKELEELREIIRSHNLWLFSDEVYREFVYDGEVHHSAMNLKGVEQQVVMLDSVSKRYSCCGARIGCLISKNKEVVHTALKLGQARLSPPTFGQIAAEAAIDAPESYFDKVHKEYTTRRNYMVDALNKIEGVFCPMPKGAFYSIARLPVDDADKFSKWLLSDFHYKNQTVMVAPASGFYSSPGKGKNEVRIAYVLKTADLRNAMETLEHALKEYPGRKI